ncbi:MAG TPA: flagellar hook basal-body protein [Opitutaceae bacterium]|nr:flagellar hook basal-body protein [Opitutaceae bacterium]
MNIGLYQSAASLTALERWQDAVTQNITASQVSGFKKRTVEFSGTEMGEINDGDGKDGISQSGVLPKASYGVNFQAGETQPTGRPLDVAIQGEGFFKVQTPAGDQVFTRAGELHLSPDHTLINKDGNAILSDQGSPITLQPEGGDPVISDDGTVKQGDNQIGKIGVFRFENVHDLNPLGGGQFTPAKDQEVIGVDRPMVLQGYLENSNVTPLREMVSLVQISRAYEANQKLISSRDQTMQRTLETLG